MRFARSSFAPQSLNRSDSEAPCWASVADVKRARFRARVLPLLHGFSCVACSGSRCCDARFGWAASRLKGSRSGCASSAPGHGKIGWQRAQCHAHVPRPLVFQSLRSGAVDSKASPQESTLWPKKVLGAGRPQFLHRRLCAGEDLLATTFNSRLWATWRQHGGLGDALLFRSNLLWPEAWRNDSELRSDSYDNKLSQGVKE